MRLRVFPSVEAPSQARRELASLASRIDQGSLSGVRTVISELVAMSVVNGARKKPIEVALHLDDGRLEGVLCDDGIGARAISQEKRIWLRMNVQPV